MITKISNGTVVLKDSLIKTNVYIEDDKIKAVCDDELYFDKEYAVHFNGSNDFYNIVDELLNGNYTDKISDAIANERKTFNKFIEQINLEKFS